MQNAIEITQKIAIIASLLLSVTLLSVGTFKLIRDTRKAGKLRFRVDTIILFLSALLVPVLTTTFLQTNFPAKDQTQEHEFMQTDAEVFRMREGETYVVGTMDEIMEWIDENDITHVTAIFQLNDRESLETWRALHPEGVPSKKTAATHDQEEFLHFAIVPKDAMPLQKDSKP